ncbi:PhzF family phenazine biosynthesis protein [Minwuia sp.]|uniref:PhzF family phenazine biosynthesis protein n=1 Tax=Minwuia sp. TaxID=2493630 RepID=UPI003A8FF616
MRRRFIQCDVFTSEPTRGNGLAVVLDAAGLSDEAMQRFAAWTNLAETTFILPPEDDRADYLLKIFTPTREMPFAGHPTLGSCAAWLHTGGTPGTPGVVRQMCGVGLVEIDIRGDVPAFAAPPTDIRPMDPAEQRRISERLRIDPACIVRSAALENGPVWQVLELASAEDVLAVDSSKVRWPDFKAIGLIGPYPAGSECDYETRMLAPSSGMSEDPITGSLNAAIARWMHAEERLNRDLLVSQGQVIGRKGRIHIRRDAGNPDRILIGGATQILIEGHLEL